MKYVIIGASGYLGNSVYKALVENKYGEIYGTCYRREISGLISLNLMDQSEIHKVISINPDVVIWCACDPENEMEITHTGLQKCITNLTNNTRFIYVSTMIGTGENQKENTIPIKRSEMEYLYSYINEKIDGESIVRTHKNHVIVRPGSIYGFDCDGHVDVRMKRLLAALNNGNTYLRTANMYTCYVNVIDLSYAIIELANICFTGTINISGEKPVSYFAFYKYLAKLMHIDENCIVAEYKQQAIYNTFDNSLRRNVVKTPISEIL